MLSINSVNTENPYNNYIYTMKPKDTDESNETDSSNNSNTTDEPSLKELKEENSIKYSISFEERAMIQQQMTMKSLFMQFTINSTDSEEEKETVRLEEKILKGEQINDTINIIDSNVSATTDEKNQYISDKINGTDTSSETNTSEDTSTDGNNDYQEIEVL